MWMWLLGGAVALALWLVGMYERDLHASKRGIPMNTERRQMFVEREQKDRLGAL